MCITKPSRSFNFDTTSDLDPELSRLKIAYSGKIFSAPISEKTIEDNDIDDSYIRQNEINNEGDECTSFVSDA